MRSLIVRMLAGFLTLAAGLAFGVYQFYLSPAERDELIAALPRAADLFAPVQPRGEPKAVAGPAQLRPRTFAPASPLFSDALVDRVRVEEKRRSLAEKTDGGRTPSPDTWTTVVTVGPRGAGGTGRLTKLRPDDDAAEYRLVMDIQRELKRVGCYSGALDGEWDAGAKRAVSAFMSAVNATLPVDKPDYALLTLVQGHSGQVCGVNCGRGQVVGLNGRCLPSTIVAQAPQRDPDQADSKSTPAPQPSLVVRSRPGAAIAAREMPRDIDAVVAAQANTPQTGLMAMGARVPAPIAVLPAAPIVVAVPAPQAVTAAAPATETGAVQPTAAEAGEPSAVEEARRPRSRPQLVVPRQVFVAPRPHRTYSGGGSSRASRPSRVASSVRGSGRSQRWISPGNILHGFFSR